MSVQHDLDGITPGTLFMNDVMWMLIVSVDLTDRRVSFIRTYASGYVDHYTTRFPGSGPHGWPLMIGSMSSAVEG